jgi:hypothetical protein
MASATVATSCGTRTNVAGMVAEDG